jgi:hypothetical protein
MTPIMCYELNCTVCGTLSVWSQLQPVECPDDAGHELDPVQSATPVGMAMKLVHLHDGAGRVFSLGVDQDGVISTTQVSGPDPV